MTGAGTTRRPGDTDGGRLEAWLDRELQRGSGRLLGRGYQAAAYLLETPVGPVVVKMAHRYPLLHWLGLRGLRREAAVYERLKDVPGVPKSFGLLRGHLVLEHVDGPSLRRHEARLEDRERFFARLLASLDAMHAAGIAHGDLKRKDNILVGSGEQPYVIDFGIAWCVDPRSARWRRALFDVISQMDYNAWIKLKYRRRLENLTEKDAERYRPLLLERIARAIRVPWQKVTFRRFRKRGRRRT